MLTFLRTGKLIFQLAKDGNSLSDPETREGADDGVSADHGDRQRAMG